MTIAKLNIEVGKAISSHTALLSFDIFPGKCAVLLNEKFIDLVNWAPEKWVRPCCVPTTRWGGMSSLTTWWRHQMETFSALLALCAGNSPVPVNSPHKGQWRGALMFSLIYAWINDWVNNRETGDLRRQGGHCDVIVMIQVSRSFSHWFRAKMIGLITHWQKNPNTK